MSERLISMLARSQELDSAVWAALPDPYAPAESSPRHDAALVASLLAVEHGRASRILISEGMSTTGIALTRMQFEALCRSLWLLYAASDREVEVASAELTVEAAKAGDDLPMAAKMIDALAGKGPPGAVEMLVGFKDATMKPLHSFVHAGFHPLRRHVEGYPEPLLIQILGNSNALFTMTGATLAILAGSQGSMRAMSRLQVEFADCLPELIRAKP